MIKIFENSLNLMRLKFSIRITAARKHERTTLEREMKKAANRKK